MYAVKKVTGAFGSTPANDLQQIPSLQPRLQKPDDIYKDAKE
jgi:hypothetical protein